MTKHTKGNGIEDSSAVYAVTPENMGSGIIFNQSTGKYEVNVGDGLEIKDNKVVIKKAVNAPVASNIVDNLNSQVIGQQHTIDYGNGLIEVNGLLKFPLDTVPKERTDNAFPHSVGRFEIGASTDTSHFVDTGNLYYKESRIKITAAELGMSKILSVNSMAMDISGYRTESTWLVNQELFSDYIWLGVHTFASLDQDTINVMFQIKGIK